MKHVRRGVDDNYAVARRVFALPDAARLSSVWRQHRGWENDIHYLVMQGCA